MESGVEEVTLHTGVTLDIRVLREYSGQGKCRVVECYTDTVGRYREQLRTWAKSRNWQVFDYSAGSHHMSIKKYFYPLES